MTGEETFHPDTRALLAYGRALAGQGDPQPKVQGGGADRLAERLFVFDRTGDGRMLVRTFGVELVALFGRDLRDQDFMALWADTDQPLLRAFVGAIDAAGQPGVVRAEAEAHGGQRLGAEILLTPLRTPPASADRYLGLFQPLGGEVFVSGQTLDGLRLGSLHPPQTRAPAANLRLVVSN